MTHAFFASYVHSDDFKVLKESNLPLFKNFLYAIDAVAGDSLERVVLQTGGKVMRLRGPIRKPKLILFP